LITFVSAGYAGVIATDISDPPLGPLAFMTPSIWEAHPMSFLVSDYSIDNSLGAQKAIQTSDSIKGMTNWTADLAFSDLVAPQLADWKPLADDPSLRLLSGLTFMVVDAGPQPEI
jgi:hypothetical protein